MGKYSSDTGSFGSLQSLPSFLARFGERNDAGTHTLPAARASLMNSLPWIGKILGCLGAERFIEILGYKKTMLAAAVVQVIAIISMPPDTSLGGSTTDQRTYLLA